jgi:hypothetical protein
MPTATARPPGIANRLVCPACGNDETFIELAHDVMLTSYYHQNSDGSFTHESDATQINGEILLFCGACQEDLTHCHQRFREMIF